jgi:hypothetical protein
MVQRPFPIAAIVFLSALFLSVVSPFLRAADAIPSFEDTQRHFREVQALEQRAAAQDKQTLQAHIEKTEELRSRLTLPQDASADAAFQRNLSDDRDALARAEERLRLAEAVVNGAFTGIPQSVNGQVEKLLAGSWSRIGELTPILAGEMIRTAPNSSALLLFENGCAVRITPESEFQLVSHDFSETLYALRAGRLHVWHAPRPVGGVIGRVAFQTPTATVALRGTEFTLSLDGSNHTHLLMEKGAADITATPQTEDQDASPWWVRAVPFSEPRPLLYGKWLRVALIEGDVKIIRSDGIPRKAAIGAELSVGDSLVTGDNGFAWGLLDGGYLGAMKPHGRLRAEKQKKHLRYRLDPGVYHFETGPEKRDPADVRPTFVTATAVTAVRWTAFQATVDRDGNADWMPLEGTLEIRAVHP